MKYYQVKFIKNGQEAPKEYTFGFDGELKPKDLVDLPFGHGIVVSETSEEELSGMDKAKLKTIVKKSEGKTDGQGNGHNGSA